MSRDRFLWKISARDYDALYIAIGAHSDKKIGIDGEDAGGVISAVEFYAPSATANIRI